MGGKMFYSDYTPLMLKSDVAKCGQNFGDEMTTTIEEQNEELAV